MLDIIFNPLTGVIALWLLVIWVAAGVDTTTGNNYARR